MNLRILLLVSRAAISGLVSLFALASTTVPAAPAPQTSAAARPALFSDAPEPAVVHRPETVVRHRPVRINWGALGQARKKGALLNFNLFSDTAFIGEVETIEERSDSDYTLVGRIQGDEFSSFTLVVDQDVMVMNVRPGKGGLLEVRYLGNGVHDVRKADENLFKPCLTGPEHAVSKQQPLKNAAVRAEGDPKPQADAGDYIDVMVVYTPAARTAAGGTTAMQALINLGIAESNTAYQQSLIGMRIRLVFQSEVSYTESGFSTDLNRVTNPSDGFLDEVQGWRNTYGADLVSLWINDSSSCGQAWLMEALTPSSQLFGFSVVHWNCATGNYSFPHEMGHNMGCQHDRANGSTALFSYSYGWRFYGTNGLQYRTIMAYAPGSRIQRFSNPDVSYFGTPTGVPIGSPNPAHNAQTINKSAYTVANFRQAVDTNAPPNITAQPASQSVFVGADVTFSVGVGGTPPFSYQWKRNGSPISGATQSSYTTNNVQLSDAASYSVTVTNVFGTTNSADAALTVSQPITLGEALDAPSQSWTSGGNALWSGETSTTHDGVDAAQSGTIGDSLESWVETTVTGPGTLTFWWKVSSEAGFDFLYFRRNGVNQFGISGEVGWQQRTVNIPSGSQTLRWRYIKDSTVSAGQDKGWVDQVVFTEQSLAAALDNPGLSWANGGNAAWVYQTSVTHDGVDAAASGTITHDQYSLLQTTVTGPGTLTFWWKVSSEEDYDYLLLSVDTYVSNYISGEVNWTQVSQPIPPGTHTIQFQYDKDTSDSFGSDKGWVDQVVYVAPSTLLSNSVARVGPGNHFLFQFDGALGASYTLQASTYLTNWVTLTNVTATSLPISFVDSNILNYPRRFFRVVSP